MEQQWFAKNTWSFNTSFGFKLDYDMVNLLMKSKPSVRQLSEVALVAKVPQLGSFNFKKI